LIAEATGEVELDGKVLVIRRIHVRLTLQAEQVDRETAERVHGFFAASCPIYRSLHPQIAITTELVLQPLPDQRDP
jgi:uncharacterized OsmC-like protein